jgi:hypothetical protein
LELSHIACDLFFVEELTFVFWLYIWIVRD